LVSLGAAITLNGSQKVDLDWGYSQMQSVELEEGEISPIPANIDQVVTLGIEHGKEKKTYHVFGGEIGLVLDARAKPLPLVFGQEESRKNLVAWQQLAQRAEML
jgi:hypothetical protein